MSLWPEQLCRRLRLRPQASAAGRDGDGLFVDVAVENEGAFDVNRALVMVFSGDPLSAADPAASKARPNILLRRQLGHGILAVNGLEGATARVRLGVDTLPDELWAQVHALDAGAAAVFDTACIR